MNEGCKIGLLEDEPMQEWEDLSIAVSNRASGFSPDSGVTGSGALTSAFRDAFADYKSTTVQA